MSITIETIVKIEEDRRLIVQLPEGVGIGPHRVRAVIEEAPQGTDTQSKTSEWTFPVLTEAQWPADLPLTRQEMYDDDGR